MKKIRLIDCNNIVDLLKIAKIEEDGTFTLLTGKYLYIIDNILKNKTSYDSKFLSDNEIVLNIKTSKKSKNNNYYYIKIDDILKNFSEEEKQEYDLYILLLNNKHMAIKEIIQKRIIDRKNIKTYDNCINLEFNDYYLCVEPEEVKEIKKYFNNIKQIEIALNDLLENSQYFYYYNDYLIKKLSSISIKDGIFLETVEYISRGFCIEGWHQEKYDFLYNFLIDFLDEKLKVLQDEAEEYYNEEEEEEF